MPEQLLFRLLFVVLHSTGSAMAGQKPDAEIWADTLMPMAVEKGPSIVKYDEAGKVKDTKIVPKLLLEQHKEVKAIAELQNTAKSVLKQALGIWLGISYCTLVRGGGGLPGYNNKASGGLI